MSGRSKRRRDSSGGGSRERSGSAGASGSPPAKRKRANTDELPAGVAADLSLEPAEEDYVINKVKELVIAEQDRTGRDTSEAATEAMIERKVENQIVHLENKEVEILKKGAPKQRFSGRNTKPISNRKRKLKGVGSFGPVAYKDYLPLHQLWSQYVATVVSGVGPDSFVPKLTKADMHGALINVVQAKQPSHVGINGIVLQETVRVFKIVTPKDKMKVLPKAGTVFVMQVGAYAITLYGDQFCFRGSERAVRKFKVKSSIAL